MGNLFGSCMKAKDTHDNNSGSNQGYKKQDQTLQSRQNKDRVTEQDKAILDVKARMRKIKTYVDKIVLQVDQQNDKVREFLKDKQKQRALIALKHKKFLEKELEKASGAQSMLQQTINNIESAQMDVEVMEALKQGDKVITELQSKASLDDFEELYERHQEQKDKMEMEQEFFGQVFNEDDLQDELNALDAEIVEQMIPSAPTDMIEQPEGEKRNVLNEEREYEQPAQKRQMLQA